MTYDETIVNLRGEIARLGKNLERQSEMLAQALFEKNRLMEKNANQTLVNQELARTNTCLREQLDLMSSKQRKRMPKVNHGTEHV